MPSPTTHRPAMRLGFIEYAGLEKKLRGRHRRTEAAESVRCAQSQIAEQLAAEVHPEAIGRGIDEQSVACRLSPWPQQGD
jgi:hypothetical protein